MDNIIFFKEKNKHGFEKPYVKIERNYLESLKRYIGTNFKGREISKLLRENTDEYIVIPVYYFQELIESMIFQTDLHTDAEFYNSVAGQFGDSYKTSLERYMAIRGDIKRDNIVSDYSRSSLAKHLIEQALFENDLEPLKQCINISRELLDTTYKIFKQRDLKSAKTYVLESLKYIVSPVELEKYNQEYIVMLNENPIDLEKIEKYLKSLQQIILEDWKKGVTSLEDYKPGDLFRFICHSTDTSTFNGDFYSSLVSCSLLTEEFTDTYRSGFGFILSPEAIVGADGDDMYVNNYTDEDEEMLNSSTVPKIASIGKVLEQCRSHREENKKNGDHSKVYSEVVIKGFQPIGIFCLTVGEKSLNRNYQSAKKLQEQYPHLPIIEIDLTYYKDKDSLIFYRNSLLFEIERNINPSALKKDSDYYDLYEYFWDQYLKLKKNKEYRESDIIDLYRENSELISMRIEPGKLLSGKYSIEAIEFAIMNNPLYKLKRILSEKVTPYDIKNLSYELINYADNELLNEAIPGLGSLLRIIDIIEVEKIDIDLILQTKPITIESIRSVLQIELDRKAEIVRDEISELEGRKQTLANAYTIKEQELKTNLEHKRVIDFSYLYSLAHSDYQIVETNLSEEERERAELDQEYTTNSESYGSYRMEQQRLSKHKIFNFFKLRKLNVEIMKLNLKMDSLKTTIESKDKSIQTLQTELSDMRVRFREQTGIELLDYDSALEHSQEQYSMSLEFTGPYDLEKIQSQIDIISERLTSLLNKQQHIEEISMHKKG